MIRQKAGSISDCVLFVLYLVAIQIAAAMLWDYGIAIQSDL